MIINNAQKKLKFKLIEELIINNLKQQHIINTNHPNMNSEINVATPVNNNTVSETATVVAPETNTNNQTSSSEQFFVRNLAGNHLVFSYSPDIPISQIKQTIFENENIPVDHQRLIFQGKQLEDAKKLSDYGIQSNSTIHLVLRLRGGAEITIEVNFN
jgi:hypothetical protein